MYISCLFSEKNYKTYWFFKKSLDRVTLTISSVCQIQKRETFKILAGKNYAPDFMALFYRTFFFIKHPKNQKAKRRQQYSKNQGWGYA